jgi:hypothetical protein
MTEPSPYPIQSELHAWHAGQVWGVAMRHGLELRPESDAEGNWAASALLDLPGGVTIRLVVDAPTEED